jgi:hypothetical protein
MSCDRLAEFGIVAQGPAHIAELVMAIEKALPVLEVLVETMRLLDERIGLLHAEIAVASKRMKLRVPRGAFRRGPSCTKCLAASDSSFCGTG